jgi:hypothetical protein
MAKCKIDWTGKAKEQFRSILQRANHAGQLESLIEVHDEMLRLLCDVDTAMGKGEILFSTKKAGGEVRHWIVEMFSICYAIFPEQQVAWIVKCATIPEKWPVE